MIHIPAGTLAVPSNDDNAAAEQRRRIAEMLRNNEPISVSHTGTVHSANETPDGTPVEEVVDGEVEVFVPKGVLA